MKSVFSVLILFLLFRTDYVSALENASYAGKIQLGRTFLRSAMLHVRKVAKSSDNMIAVLAVADDQGNFVSGRKYHFSKYIAGADDSTGSFLIERMLIGEGVGTQVIALDLMVDPQARMHGSLTSNLIMSDGALLEGEFVLEPAI